MPVGVALTSGLSGPGRLLTFPAPRWPAGRYFLCQRYCPRQFSGFFFLGVPLGSGGPAGDPVFLRAFLTPGLLFLGGFATAPAESECLGEFGVFPSAGSFAFLCSPRRSAGSCAFWVPSVELVSWVWGFCRFCGTAFILFDWRWERDSIDEKLSFRMVYPAITCPTPRRAPRWKPWPRVGGSRWRIETEFETEKSDVGMDEYETRTWAGWHHHIALSLLAGAFLLSLQQAWGEKDAPGQQAAGVPCGA